MLFFRLLNKGMEEREIIQKLQILQEIRPRKEWIKTADKKILGTQRNWEGFLVWNVFRPKPVFLAGGLMIIISLALFGLLYAPKEKTDNLPSLVKEIASQDIYDYNYYLEKAISTLNQRNEKENSEIVEKTKIALEKAVEKLPPRPKSPKESEKIVKKVKEIEDALTTLGPEKKEIKEATEKLKEKTKEMIQNEIYRIQVEAELMMLESRTLTDEQRRLLEEAKKDYYNEDYLSALEKILRLTNQQ